MSASFDGRLTRLLRYWAAKRGDQPAPRRADLDPLLEIPDLVPMLTLIDVLRDPLRFRFRLVGTSVVQALGRDATGRFADEALYGSEAAGIVATYRRMTEEIRPFHRRSRLAWNDREWRVLEAVEVPLIDDDGRVCMIMGGNRFTLTSDTDGPPRTYEPIDLDPLPGRDG